MSAVKLRGSRAGIAISVLPDATPADVARELSERLRRQHRFYRGAQFFLEPGAAGDAAMRAAIQAVFSDYPELTFLSAEPPAHSEEVPPRFIRGTLRSGDRIWHGGDVVIWGNVNEGAEVIAAGDIYVRGAVFGKVHAGVLGDAARTVHASLLQPTQIRIAHIIGLMDRPRRTTRWRQDVRGVQVARVQDGTIVIESTHV